MKTQYAQCSKPVTRGHSGEGNGSPLQDPRLENPATLLTCSISLWVTVGQGQEAGGSGLSRSDSRAARKEEGGEPSR